MMEENTVHASDSVVDKSRIVEVKPLRSLAPVLPKSIQSFFPAQYPSVFPPFVSLEKAQEIPVPKATHDAKKTIETPVDKATHDAKKTLETPVDKVTPDVKATPGTPVTEVTPIRFYNSSLDGEATAHANGYTEGLNGEFVDDKKKCSASSSKNSKAYLKRKEKAKDPKADDLSSLVGISLSQKGDGDREVVNRVLMTFDSLRRRLCQLEDANECNATDGTKVPYMRASNTLTSKGIRTNTRRRVGVVPGVEIGDVFFFRMEMCLVGLHSPPMAGIDYMLIKDGGQEEPVALSVVSSGVYDDNTEDDDILIYSGQGENFSKKDKHVIDQKLQRGNLALDRSAQRRNEIRVTRGLRDAVNKNTKIYVYDGLYKIQDSWIEKGKSGGGVFKYKLVRLPGQPSAFAVWKLIQKWKENPSSRNGLIVADLSTGIESIPVSLVNDVDHEKGPAFFTYFHSLKNPKPFSIKQPSYGCNCNKTCVPGDFSCSCIQRNDGDFPYTANSILVSRKPLIHECGTMCRCFPNCKNRVSQTGLKHHLEVFKTKDRGWGLRTLDPLRAGTYICEYAGEVFDRAKVCQNGEGDNDEYVFDTSRICEPFKWNYEPSLLEEVSPNISSEDYLIPSPLIISAKNKGNVARFMNHSCSPNVFWQPVLYSENDQPFLHIAFFALRHIPPMTELTYDYGIVPTGHTEGSSAPRGRKKCLCRSTKCRGFFG